MLHPQSGADGPLWIILAGHIHAPQRHHAVAIVLVNHAAVLVDDAIQLCPHSIDDFVDGFGVQRLGHRRETGNIGKQHRDLFALELRCRSTQNSKLLLDARNCRVHSCIAQEAALCF